MALSGRPGRRLRAAVFARLRAAAFARALCVSGALALFGLLAVPSAQAQQTPFADIGSAAGPFTHIFIGNDLGCQVVDSQAEFFGSSTGPADCGTFVGTIASGRSVSKVFGPDFADHAITATGFGPNYTAFTPDPNAPQTVTQSGTTTDVTTTELATDGAFTLRVVEVDIYTAGSDFYTTTIGVENTNTDLTFPGGELYHAGDCLLDQIDAGYGAILTPPPTVPATDGPAVACTANANDSPPSAVEEMIPLGQQAPTGQPALSAPNYTEEPYGTQPGTIWGDIAGQATFTNNCACTTDEDNAEGLEWNLGALPPGTSDAFVFVTRIEDHILSATGGQAFTGTAPYTASGPVATFSDMDVNTVPSDYTATINWGDGSPPAQGAIAGSDGSFTVNGSHTYTTPGSYTITVAVSYNPDPTNAATATSLATITAPPPPSTSAPTVPSAPGVASGTTGAQVSGTVTPNGLATSAYFQYQLSPSSTSPGGPPIVVQTTPVQQVGADFSSHVVSATLSGLAPNASYQVQLIATNSAGTTKGPLQTFSTKRTPPPPPPVVGAKVNVSVTAGKIWVKVGTGAFEPLTEGEQIPTGAEIDSLHGTMKLITAGPTKHSTQTATVSGAVFKLTQTRNGPNKGLANLTLTYGAFANSPTTAVCKPHHGKAQDASLSSRILQTLHASAHGRFRTSGRYGAATVRGTVWSITDKCNGTLFHAIVHSILIQNFVRHISLLLTAGHTYLVRAP